MFRTHLSLNDLFRFDRSCRRESASSIDNACLDKLVADRDKEVFSSFFQRHQNMGYAQRGLLRGSMKEQQELVEDVFHA